MTNGTRPLLCERFFCFRGRSPPLNFCKRISGSWVDLWLLHPTLNNVAKMPGRDPVAFGNGVFYCLAPKRRGKMVSKIEEISKDQNGAENHILPPCIGFGVLDASRTRIEYPEDKNGEPIINASYLSYEGELVYKVRLGKESCLVEELFEGRVVETTISPTLKEAFSQKFLCIGKNPRFRQMMGRIAKDRNIAFIRPGRDGFRTSNFTIFPPKFYLPEDN